MCEFGQRKFDRLISVMEMTQGGLLMNDYESTQLLVTNYSEMSNLTQYTSLL